MFENPKEGKRGAGEKKGGRTGIGLGPPLGGRQGKKGCVNPSRMRPGLDRKKKRTRPKSGRKETPRHEGPEKKHPDGREKKEATIRVGGKNKQCPGNSKGSLASTQSYPVFEGN